MIIRRTVKVFLPDEAAAALLPTAISYTNAYNLVCQDGYAIGSISGYDLHKRNYLKLRETLPSQLAISARMKAVESLTSVRGLKKAGYNVSCPKSKLTSIRYDMRSYTLWLTRNEVSILTLEGRKTFKFFVHNYYKQYLGWKHKSADLVIYGSKAQLNVVFEKEITDTEPNCTVIGADRGENNLVVLSNNVFFTGRKIKQRAMRYNRLRKTLQAKQTKSAKRHLVRVRGQEKRFRADVNHTVAKQIVAALKPGDTLVLEDLTGIRKRAKRNGKEQRYQFHNWGYFQLEQFLVYKAEAKGISVVFVDARYTSQCCSKCGQKRKANRNGSNYKCKQCKYSCNADLNAARNIAEKHRVAICKADRAPVNEPNGNAAFGSIPRVGLTL
jgi:putative transposase